MNLTGKSLELVREALDLALDALDNEIGTCPDVTLYAAELVEAEKKKDEINQLIFKIDARNSKEQP